ncbi:hypothetical protein Plec18167_007592 [Paecilomyces lecythidis]|uniref:Uncharacterized protein n=1 Tax=Paecilomyces lecythidis TaxID=3004212 RepID=A0ABR3X2U2_9EURO
MEDPISAGLRHLSQQLTTITITGLVGKELFWPFDPKEETPFWPNLKTFYLFYVRVTPSGKWLFERDGEEDEDELLHEEEPHGSVPDNLFQPEEDQYLDPFRTRASPELMGDFYVSAGHAAQRMPKLSDVIRPCYK